MGRLGREAQERRVVRHFAFLYGIVFIIVLPYLCYDFPFSNYYRLLRRDVDGLVHSYIGRRNEAAYKAHQYFSDSGDKLRRMFQSEKESPWLAVGIITIKRHVKDKQYRSFKPQFVLEVAARVSQVLEKYPQRNNVVLRICNVESNPDDNTEALFISHYIPTFFKPVTVAFNNTYEKEKRDYMFCLREMSRLGPKYILLLEDDALIDWNFFSILREVMESKIENRYRRGELQSLEVANLGQVKLYFPEKVDGYSWDRACIVELFSVGCVGGMIIACLYEACSSPLRHRARTLVAILSFTFVVMAAFSIGRPHMLSFRRFSSVLHFLGPGPSCCTPAVLYPMHSATVVLDRFDSPLSQTSSSRAPLDLLISVHLGIMYRFDNYRIFPNLVEHLSIFSTLRELQEDPRDLFPLRS
ncbi:GPI-N-acetylgalactosamine transferase PGAP4-like [Saccoglossus kowalevskii]|uniref:Transmembrane protein 246-like n=1 Tax=Saccoglossus kowalevskii TaxID=10224 RepID=A0ABM0GRT6_SACKO|nr:PREDICTED: transmembrane protein 246-like [Saccoglossus kowalevskii]